MLSEEAGLAMMNCGSHIAAAYLRVVDFNGVELTLLFGDVDPLVAIEKIVDGAHSLYRP